MLLKSFEDLERLRNELREKKKKENNYIAICNGPGCLARGALAVSNAFKEELEKRGLDVNVKYLKTGCLGLCEKGVLVVKMPENIQYQLVKPKDVPEIVEETILNNRVVERLVYKEPFTGEKYIHTDEIPFYKTQKRYLLESNLHISPESIEDYIANGGYSALPKALKMQPEEIIDIIKKSGLRGRGGGGFPTGKKWESCRKAEGEIKYVICNADEGDPGAFMDRALLEGNPHSVLEGMIIGAFAIGSNDGYIYVRQEYPLAVKYFTQAIKQAREYGILGENILGTGFKFDVKVNRGGGAFVCGESTALMASIEGKVGEPRAKHIHTVEKGLWERPTTLNNVETWACVPLIINNGWEWFASMGTENSKGTKIFSLVGKVNNTGLVEVPMGMSLREIVFNIGGGIKNNKKFKAVQTGGPSGGVIPEHLLDMPVDYDELTKVGSMMGSGGMIVMDEDNCMVDIAKYFTNFLKDESCGKCTPCREGLIQMSEILERISKGEGKEGDIELLEEIGWVMKETSLCALGTSAPNPVLSTIKFFRDEYDAHIKEKRCPAKVCKPLIRYRIIKEKCTGCSLCAMRCPQKVITGEPKKPYFINQEGCIKCGICYDSCQFDAIEVI
uniref:NADH-quinone oxidoreductase subunit NuoF n=1 Tax=candidate division WOR-3 bacterium TaxID=2052148 RepID=A0A7C4UCF0_UNCW3